MIEQFPDLYVGNANMFYKAEILFNYEELEERINKIKQTGEAVPILLFIYKE